MPRTHERDRRDADNLIIFAGVARPAFCAAWSRFVPRGISLRTLIATAINVREARRLEGVFPLFFSVQVPQADALVFCADLSAFRGKPIG